ncbi:MAG: nucleotide sugar dehydrogenase [Xanthomonadaceae bacterium]|nr:nucleotide sugar dehydrogenase [Xanthomonadaceae bacterium]
MSFSLQLADARIGVAGLGYVGLPLAVALGREFPTLGYDRNPARVSELRAGRDATGEVETAELTSAKHLRFSADTALLKDCNVYIVAVPTPVTPHKMPDLSPLVSASETIGTALKRGDVVIYESTVYPGATEEVCVPVLERVSGLRLNTDFFVGYSPERINPGDKQRRLADIVKVTSGSTPAAAEFVDALYRRIVRAGTHRAPGIRVAEAAKAIENIQRDVNIALVNELALIFGKLGIDTEAVLEAAGTKWNFLKFRPGLVGGHCIGVDPYYLIHKASEARHYPELISAARRINEGMSAHVAAQILRLMALKRIDIVGSRILVLGITFKEDCPDLRNTRVREIVDELRACHANVDVLDPWADKDECERECGIRPIDTPAHAGYEAIVLAVAHRQFRELGAAGVRAFAKPKAVIYDVKYLLPTDAVDGRL